MPAANLVPPWLKGCAWVFFEEGLCTVPNELDASLDMMPAHPMSQGGSGTAGLCLLFTPGERPDVDAIAQLVEASMDAGLSAAISHRPPAEEGWLELLASGLTFDLVGLRPASPGRGMGARQSFGFATGMPPEGGESIELLPSGHIISGAGLLPVVRTMLGLAANLAVGLPVRAVGWGPAQTWMEPGYFCRSVLNWLGGGSFPVLGLTSLLGAADGSLVSHGLAHFTGQEIQLQGRPGEAAADCAKLAVRVIDRLVAQGRIAEPMRLDVDGEGLFAEPSKVGQLVLIWREDDA